MEHQQEQMELRSTPSEFNTSLRTIKGYGIRFNHWSRDLGGFTERILPEAVSLDLLNSSDIKVYLEHDKQRGILARSKQGNGSLKYSIDDLGVVYEFEAPNTQLGNEVLEGLNRGDYDESSFAFTVKRDSWETKGGKYYRTIHEIERMYDFSIVADGAYSETYVSVAKRSLNDYIAGIDMEVRNKEEDKPEDKEKQEEESAEATTEAPEEEGTDTVEDNKDREPDSDSLKEEEEEKEEDKDKRNNLNKEEMEFSLIKTINDVVNRRSFNESAAAVIEQGQAEMRKAGLTYNGDIILPTEYRADIKSTTGAGAIATNVQSIISPIYDSMVFSKAGATYLSGLNGDVKVPVLNGSTVGWADEVGAAADAAASIESVTLTPKRLTAFVDVSKQFLLQETASAEEALKQDIIRAIAQKLEATILDATAKSTTRPAGLFNGVTADTASITWAQICTFEAQIDGKEMGNKCWIVSPSAKGLLKQTAKGGNRFVLEGNEIEGYPVYCTAAATTNGVLFGDFSDLVIAQWGATEIVVDPYSQAGNGKVRLIVNAYFDAQIRRSGSILKKVIKA